MAGFSGGRKSICPGLVNVQSVRDFHGPKTVAHPQAPPSAWTAIPATRSPLEIGGMAPAGLHPQRDHPPGRQGGGRVRGRHGGGARGCDGRCSELRPDPPEARYDVVVVHGGLVGVNHYQAEKAADIAGRAVRDGGYAVVIADTTEPDPLAPSRTGICCGCSRIRP